MRNNKFIISKLSAIISGILIVSSNIDAMTVKSLNKDWYFNKGYESQTQWKESINLPHTWNAAL